MRVGIVAKRDSDRAIALASDVAAGVASPDVEVRFEETSHDALLDHRDAGATDSDGSENQDVPPSVPLAELADCDLVVCVGGDGTFLLAARHAGTAPLLGVNLGEVGFLTAVEPAAAVETTQAVVTAGKERGRPQTMTVPRLAAGGSDWRLGPAVNEVVLQGPRRGHGGGLDVTVSVDGDQYWAGHADGVMVATPFGSTAYNVSEGGPLVEPGVGGLVVTGMASVAGMPPLVVPDEATITLEAAGARSAIAVADGHCRREFTPPASLAVELAAEPLTIAEPSIDFYAALSKLD